MSKLCFKVSLFLLWRLCRWWWWNKERRLRTISEGKIEWWWHVVKDNFKILWWSWNFCVNVQTCLWITHTHTPTKADRYCFVYYLYVDVYYIQTAFCVFINAWAKLYKFACACVYLVFGKQYFICNSPTKNGMEWKIDLLKLIPCGWRCEICYKTNQIESLASSIEFHILFIISNICFASEREREFF